MDEMSHKSLDTETTKSSLEIRLRELENENTELKDKKSQLLKKLLAATSASEDMELQISQIKEENTHLQKAV